MATNLLSAAECKNATSNGAGVRKLHDGDGLYLWVYLDGRKYWRMRYWQVGKEKSLSVGVYPKVSLSDARKKRDELRKQLQADLDPSAERKATTLRKKLAAENSFEAIALEWHGKQKIKWVAHHANRVKRLLELSIFPVLGKHPIGQIEAPELLGAIRKIEARGAHDLAHRVLQICGQVFRYGIATGRCTRILNETGFKPDVIERQLAHCERNEVRGAYNRAEYLPERKKMMQQWADYLDKLKAGAEIIPLLGNAA